MRDAFNNINDKIITIVYNGSAITDDVMRKTVCFVYMKRNICLGFIVWDVYTNGNVYLGFTMWDVHTNGNDWASIIVCDGSPDRTRALFAPRV